MKYEKIKLSDLVDTVSDTRKINKDKVVLINTSDIFDGDVLNHSYTDNSNLRGQFKKRFEKNDILYSEIRPANKRFAYVDFDSEDYIASTKLMVLRKKSNSITNRFLYYCLTNDFFTEKMQHLAEARSGTFPQITFDVLKNESINVPSIENQNKITMVLDNINNKIKSNNEINNNLHDLCNNLYFKLVSQLNDTNSSVESIKNVAKCVLGGTPSRTKKEYWNGSINWINSGEINKFRIIKASEKITELGLNKSSTTLLPRGTTVLAITGATLGQVSRLEIDSCANQSVIGIITNKKELNNYMYLSILNSINDLVLKKTGGAQQHINKNDVETHEIIVPSTELISQFDEIIRPLFDQISVNCFEINKLEQLRDTLLPKLMNDEIDLANIEI